MKTMNKKLNWDYLIKYDLVKIYLKIKDYNIINTGITFLDLKKSSKNLIELFSKIILN